MTDDLHQTRPPKPETHATPLEVRPFEGAAAGPGAVYHAMRHAVNEMGVIRSAQTLLSVNQKSGFDCPGCAWPDPEHRATAEFCENGAKAVAAEATLKRVTPEFFAKFSIPELLTRSDHWLEAQGRLTQPMVRERGADHYVPVDWDTAFSRIAKHLNALASPDEALFYTSGRTSNEAAFLYQLFVRQLGTNNLPDCSNMCHESSGVGLGETLGVGKGTVSLEDFEHADAIFILGQNPGTNHPRMLLTLQAAARRGCHIVSINPLREAALMRFSNPQEITGWLGASTPLTEHFLQVRINGDVALLKGIMKEVLEAERRAPGTVLDHAFLKAHTAGFDPFVQALDEVSWEDILRESGISRAQIQEVASLYCRSQRVIFCWAMGLTQHKNGVGNIQEVVNLLLLRGNIGKKGAGVCPVRGHSNVQGDRTMGINEKPSKAFLDALERVFQFSVPRKHGLGTVHAISAMLEGKAKVFFALGGNFHSASPDTRVTETALQKCRLTVQVSTKLNRSHLMTGEEAFILPTLGRTERDIQENHAQFVTTENSMGVVQPSRGNLMPASPSLLSEVQIVARLARATLGNRSQVDWLGLGADYSKIRQLIGEVIPGFQDFNARLEREGSITLPNRARALDFETSTKKANFTVHPIPHHPLRPDQFMMMTIRSHDQYNTTIYDLNDRYRGVFRERRVVFMNNIDIQSHGLVEGQAVDLVGEYHSETRIAPDFIVVKYDIPRGCIATYFPEANVLVPLESYADKSMTPTSKSIIVRIQTAKMA